MVRIRLSRRKRSLRRSGRSTISSLPRLENCRSAAIGTAFYPQDSAANAKFERAKDALTEARALRRIGQQEQSLSVAKRAIEIAHEIGWIYGEAEGSYLTGAAQAWMRIPDAPTTLVAALNHAEAARADDLRAEILIDSMNALIVQGRSVEAATLGPVALAALHRVGDPPDLVSRHYNAVANVDSVRGRAQHALDEYSAAVRARQTIAGPDDFWLLGTQANLANAHFHLGDYEAQVALLSDVLVHMTNAYGPHPARSRLFSDRSTGYAKLHRFEDALRSADEALALLAAAAVPNAISLGVAHANRGNALVGLDRVEEGLAEYTLSSGLYVKASGPESARSAEASVNLARGHLKHHDLVNAATAITRALEIYEKGQKKGSPDHALAMVVGAEVFEAKHELERARASAEEALRILDTTEGDPVDLAEVQFALARLLPAVTANEARIGDLASHARAVFAARPWLEKELARLDAWSARPHSH